MIFVLLVFEKVEKYFFELVIYRLDLLDALVKQGWVLCFLASNLVDERCAQSDSLLSSDTALKLPYHRVMVDH